MHEADLERWRSAGEVSPHKLQATAGEELHETTPPEAGPLDEPGARHGRLGARERHALRQRGFRELVLPAAGELLRTR